MFAAALQAFATIHVSWPLQVVASWKAHTKNVRALHYDGQQNLLLTGSFERSCKVYSYQPVDHADTIADAADVIHNMGTMSIDAEM